MDYEIEGYIMEGSEMNAWSTTVTKSGDTYTITPGNVYQYSGTQI